MDSMAVYKMGAQVVPRLLSIRKGTILAILAGLFLAMVLLVWLVFASLGWFANRMPTALGSGEQMLGSLVQQGLQAIESAGLVSPDLQSRINQVAVLATAEQPVAEQAIKDVVTESVSGVKRYLGAAIPATTLPVRDVSGVDIAPVARYPGFVRSSFATDSTKRMVGYKGRASFESVINHYVSGLQREGYRHVIVSAMPQRELHHFILAADGVSGGEAIIEAEFLANAEDLVEIVISAND